MAGHVDENARREQKHMVVEPLVLTSQPSNQHCNDACINEMLL
jgi:hypothetical protein